MRCHLVLLLKSMMLLSVGVGCALLYLHCTSSLDPGELPVLVPFFQKPPPPSMPPSAFRTPDPKFVHNRFRPMMAHRFHRILHPRDCSSAGQELVIYIHSAPAHSFKRQLVRKTWGSPEALAKINASLVFVLGVVHDGNSMVFVQNEHLLYQDILQEDFIDSYRNLTYKAMAGLKWVSQRCSKAHYVLKTDDDILTDIFQLRRLLRTKGDLEAGGRGFVACNHWHDKTDVVRDPRDKWFVSKREFAGDSYGSFCQGSAFVVSMDVAQALFRLSFSTPFFRLDDVYVTGFLLQQLNVTVLALNHLYMDAADSMMDFHRKNPLDSPLFIHNKPRPTFRYWNYMERSKCCPIRL